MTRVLMLLLLGAFQVVADEPSFADTDHFAALYSKGTLALEFRNPLIVESPSCLVGKLNLNELGKAKSNQSHTALTAKTISGCFENDKISLVGQSYSIG